MIRCNLAVILAEQNLKITKVSADTGISRTTLTSLVSNKSQGIQLDTINSLCLYLKITPDRLLSFIPYDVNIISVEKKLLENSEEVYFINIRIYEYRHYTDMTLYGSLKKYAGVNEDSYMLRVSPVNPFNPTEKYERSWNHFQLIPEIFIGIIENRIVEAVFPNSDYQIFWETE